MFGDFGKILKVFGEVKAKLPELRAKLAQTAFAADAGGGAVSATVMGDLRIAGLKIKQELLGQTDVEMLEDLIKAAVSAAQAKAIQATKQAMAEITGELNIPGFDGLLG